MNDPYAPPQAADDPKPLGNLAQSARGKELKQAQRILIVIGALTMIANGFMIANTPNEIDQVVKQNNIDPAQLATFRQAVTIFCYGIYGGMMLLGLLFIALGLIVQRYPVPITIASLVLYIAANLVMGLLNPMSLASGLIVKIIVIVFLFRAIKAARAYEGFTRKTTALASEPLA